MSDKEAVRETYRAVLGYCRRGLLAPILPDGLKLSIRQYRRGTFAAWVWPPRRADLPYDIEIAQGVVPGLEAALDLIEEEDIQAVSALFAGLLPEDVDPGVMLRAMLYSSLTFIVLHEASHACGGHFPYLARRFGADEVNNLALDALAFEGDGTHRPSPELARVQRLLELDADAIAFDLLYHLADEIFSANEELKAAILPEMVFGSGERQQKLSRIGYICAVLVMTLLEAQRVEKRARSDSHPSPLARAFSLGLALFQRSVPGNWRQEGAEFRLTLDDDLIAIIKQQFYPLFLDGLDLSIRVVRHLGLDPATVFRLPVEDAGIMERLGSDFTHILIDRMDAVQTEIGREFAKLQAEQRPFIEEIEPERLVSWYR